VRVKNGVDRVVDLGLIHAANVANVPASGFTATSPIGPPLSQRDRGRLPQPHLAARDKLT
jgi:hypothetical protein